MDIIVNHSSMQPIYEQIGDQISSFIQIFDKLMKRYVAGSLGAREIEQMYLEYLNKGVGLI